MEREGDRGKVQCVPCAVPGTEDAGATCCREISETRPEELGLLTDA